MFGTLVASPSLEARVEVLERRSRALALAVAILAPATATVALAAFRQSPRAPQPLPALEGERLLLRSPDGGATVVMEPTPAGGFRIRAGRVTEQAAPNATPERPSWRMQGAELELTAAGPSPTLELREPGGRTLARLGRPEVRPAGP